jgi:hypothetical protein
LNTTVENTDVVVMQLRTDYVQDKMFVFVVILLLQIGLVAALVGFIFYQINSFPKPIFFQTTERKQIIKPTSLENPFLSPSAVLNWSVEAMRISYSFNYRSINNHLSKIFAYFDQRGIARFFEEINANNSMKQVKPDQLIVSVQIKEAPQIVNEGKIEGRYIWRVALPIEIHYKNAVILRRQEVNVDLYIWRVPETEAPIGIKITNFKTTIKKDFEPQMANKPKAPLQ